VVAHFQALAPRITSMAQAYDARRPTIVAMAPENGARDVDPSLTKVTIKFDRPLRGGLSFCFTADKDLYPKFGKMAYDTTRTTLNAEVQFEPSRDYEFRMNCAPGFVSEEGIAMKDLLVKWHTRK
jgi:hypothetical protein